MSGLLERIAGLPPAKQRLLLKRLQEREAAAQPAIGPAPERATGGPYPLSFAQERLWFFDQLDPGTPAFNVPTVLRFTGELDAAALERSLLEIVRRHEVLRTTFRDAGGRPVQVVSPEPRLPFARVDLTALPADPCSALARRLAEREAGRGFDLAAGPLLTAVLMPLAAGEHLLVVVMHHIVSDGWSFGVMHRELALLYDAFRAGRPSPLPPPRLQYADFAAWQRAWLQGEVLEREVIFWRRRLEGLPVLELPTDHPRPQAQTFRGASRRLVVGGPVLAGLRHLAQEEGASLFMAVLAGFAALLHRYTGETDLAVGTFVANRTRVELEGLIGFFLNNLTLRTDLGGDPGLVELLRRVRRITLEAYAHQELPFEKLVEALNPERDMSRPSFFQVMCVLQNTPQPGEGLAGLTVREEDAPAAGAHYDLTLWLQELDEGLVGHLEYSPDLFDPTTMARLGGHLGRLLAAAVAEPELPVSALPLLGAAEGAQLLVEWSCGGARHPWQGGVYRRFARRALERPGAPAVTAGEVTLSYGELARRAAALGEILRRRGAGPESRVALCLPATEARIVAVLATLHAGAAYVPLDPDYGGERLAFMLADSGAVILVAGAGVGEELGDGAGKGGPQHLLLDELGEAGPDAAGISEAGAEVDPEGLAYLVYTSGSTGRAKGVMVPHGALENAYRAWEERYRLEEAHCHLQMASFSFDVFAGDLVRALCSGAELVLCPRERLLEPTRLFELMRAGGVDAAEFVPAVTRGLVEHLAEQMAEHWARWGGRPLADMRLMVVGSDTWSLREMEAVARLTGPGTRVLSSYGVSEATIDSTFFERRSAPDPRHLDRPVPIGRPFPGSRVYLLDRALRPLPAGVAGELVIGGAGLARGYHRRPGLTAGRFVPDPFGRLLGDGPGGRLYRTGDLARALPDGQVELLGRTDLQVKVRGVRIEPGEVEAALAEHPRVARAVVTARQAAPGDARLVGYVVLRPEGDDEHGTNNDLALGELREHLARRLPEAVIPSAFLVLPELPLTPNGKVDRRALPDPDWSRPELRAASEPPATPDEERMADLFSEVLGVEGVGRHDRFFDLGGHSLLATQLVSRIRRVFAVELPLRSLFEAPTVAGLSRRVEELRRRGAGAAPAPVMAPRPRPARPPLSFAQQRLWFLDRLEPGGSLYNLPFAVRLRGRLDGRRLAAALERVVARHEALRTTFAEEGGRPYQVIHPAWRPALPRVDLTALPPAEREAAVRRLARREAARPFDLEVGPLLRARLLVLAPEEHLCLLTLHHVVADAWSMGVLFAEVAALYAADADLAVGLEAGLDAGRPAPLPELPVQYADFAAWQREWLSGERLAAQLGYWRRRLAGAPEALPLPTDRPRPPVQTSRGGRLGVALPAALAERLRQRADAAGATLFMALLAAFQALLGRLAGVHDLVVGSPIANRNREEIEGLIGFFVNTLALRADLSGEPGLGELLERVRESTLEAYAHQDLPFEKLVEELRPGRDLSRSPLFQVMFVFQNAPVPLTAGAELVVEPVDLDPGTAKFDLGLELYDAPEGLAGALEYNADLFDRTTAGRWAGHLRALLEGALAEPDRPLADLPLLTAGQSHQLLVEWNVPASPEGMEETLLDRVVAQAARRPEAVAVAADEGLLTYGELLARAHRLAHHLAHHLAHRPARSGGTPEQPVAVLLPRSGELVTAMLAVLATGGVYLPLDPTHPPERLAGVLADAGASLLVTREAEPAARRLEWAGRRLLLDREPAGEGAGDGARDGTPTARPAGEGAAYLLYTSGSTGKPKGVVVPHRGLARRIPEVLESFPVRSESRVAQVVSPAFDASLLETFMALASGACLVPAAPGVEPAGEGLRGWLAERAVTVLVSVPSVLAATPARELPALATLFSGAERATAAMVSRWAPGRRLLNCYGPTETTVLVTVHPCAAGGAADPPIGRPLGGARLYVVDPTGRPSPPGVPGEIRVGGPGVARGYLGLPGRTAESFLPDPFAGEPGARLYRTGDLGRWRPGGELEFRERLDRQVKVRGVRIEPGEVEAALTAHPGVGAAAVVAVDGRLVAYLVPRKLEREPAAGELRAHLAARLPEAMVPSLYLTLPDLPRTATGKLDRRALPAPGAAAAAPASGPPPATLTEERVAALFQEVLEVEGVDAGTHFFDAGGHSLLATRLLSRLRAAFGLEIPLRLLFEAPTVARLAAELDRRRRETQGLAPPPLVPASREEEIPLSFAQQRLWFLHQLDRSSPAYNIPLALRLAGRLCAAALAAAFSGLARRHEVLRTTFDAAGGRPRQVIHPPAPVPLPVVDLSGLGGGAGEEARRLDARLAGRPFDLAAGPLLRTVLLRLGRREHHLLLCLHHAVADEGSLALLVREVTALYRAAAEPGAPPAELPELPVQVADFAIWQRRWVEGEVLAAQLAVWRRRLAGLTPLELPTDRPRPAMPGGRGGSVSRALPPAVAAGVEALARRAGATRFMVLLAALSALLGRLTGSRDLAVGTPVAHRSPQEVEGLIGFFLNSLVLRADLAGDPRFDELLERLRTVALEAYDHQDLPFERLVEELEPERDLGRSPLFQVMLTLQERGSAPAVGLPGLEVSPLPGGPARAKLDLTLFAAGGGDRLVLSTEHAVELFDPTTVQRLLGQLAALLAAAVEEPGRRLGELPLLSAGQRHQLLAEWNDTAADEHAGDGLHQRVAAQAESTPDAVALAGEEEQVSYRELRRRAGRLGRHLRALGAGADQRVALCLERSGEMVVSLWAILESGAAYLPLDPGYPGERLAFMLEDSRAVLLVTRRELAGRLPAAGPPRVLLDEVRLDDLMLGDLPVDDLPLDAHRPVPPESLAYVLYTSGSTGRPKGVMISHRAICHHMGWMQQAFPLATGDRVLQKTPASFDASVWEFWAPLLAGARLVLAAPGGHADPAYLLRTVAERAITILQVVPTLLAALPAAGGLGGCRLLRRLYCGGEALTPELAGEALAATAADLTNLYGPTEATIHAAVHTHRGARPDRRVPIGRPIANARLVVLDAAGRPAPPGVPGELTVAGRGLGRGYLGRPALTAERFVPNPFGTGSGGGEPGGRLYRTGDRVRALTDGRFDFLERLDHQVKLRGLRIELGEIEAALASYPAVARAVAVVRDDLPGGPAVVAYAVADAGVEEVATAGPEVLREHLAARLPWGMLPAAVVLLPELPLLPNGKVDRRALPAPERSREGGRRVAPRTALEEVLAGMWCELLGLEEVGVEESFFELGGHSLLATRLLAWVRDSFSAEVELRRLFERPTVAALAEALLADPAQRERIERSAELLLEMADLSEEEVAAMLAGDEG